MANFTASEGTSVAEIRPSTKGYNLTVKVLEAKAVGKGKTPLTECLVADATGSVVLVVRGDQVEKAQTGAFLTLTNAKVEMYRGSMRIVVDKWGSIEVAEGVKLSPKTDNNMSLIEFELVTFDQGFWMAEGGSEAEKWQRYHGVWQSAAAQHLVLYRIRGVMKLVPALLQFAF